MSRVLIGTSTKCISLFGSKGIILAQERGNPQMNENTELHGSYTQ